MIQRLQRQGLADHVGLVTLPDRVLGCDVAARGAGKGSAAHHRFSSRNQGGSPRAAAEPIGRTPPNRSCAL
ncbi:unnamed protein product [Lampetra planeri]